ncbi:hypothetical protein BJ944DRAFT_262932 [Cunninghamella echinulata]|nr:hypothetical protein BJ944DRAFT_262932 [Cunninghamella echinulata]
MTYLLYKSCRRLQQSRIKQLNRHIYPYRIQLLSTPTCLLQKPNSTSLFITFQHQRLLHITSISNKIYPALSFYSTLAVQSFLYDSNNNNNNNNTTLPSPSTISIEGILLKKKYQTQFIKIQELIDNDQFDEALKLLTTIPYTIEERKDAKIDTGIIQLLDPYAELLEKNLKSSNWEKGIFIYNELMATAWKPVVQYNRRIIKATLMIYCAQGKWDECERLLRHLQIQFTTKTIGRIMLVLLKLTHGNRYLVDGEKIVRSLQSFERVLNIQVNPNTIAKIINHLGERGDIEDAYQLYRWIRGEISIGSKGKVKLTQLQRCNRSLIYLAMINASIKNNDTSKAERAWHDRIYRGTFSEDPNSINFKPATLTSYNILLNIYASELPAPNLARVRRTYKRLLNHGFTPDINTYNTLIKAFVNSGKCDAAYHVFNTMLHSGTQPDSWTINTLLFGWITKREWKEVEDFVKHLQQEKMAQKLDMVTFNILIQGFLQLDGKIMAVEHILKKRGDWNYFKYLKKSSSPYSLTSKVIWDIFETVTGYKKKQIEYHYKHHLKNKHLSLSLSSLSTTNVITTSSLCQKSTKPEAINDNNNNNNNNNSNNNNKKGSFLELFQEQGADQVTYKLFIKAFLEANDQVSAKKMTQWMIDYCSPLSNKKSLI